MCTRTLGSAHAGSPSQERPRRRDRAVAGRRLYGRQRRRRQFPAAFLLRDPVVVPLWDILRSRPSTRDWAVWAVRTGSASGRSTAWASRRWNQNVPTVGVCRRQRERRTGVVETGVVRPPTGIPAATAVVGHVEHGIAHHSRRDVDLQHSGMAEEGEGHEARGEGPTWSARGHRPPVARPTPTASRPRAVAEPIPTCSHATRPARVPPGRRRAGPPPLGRGARPGGVGHRSPLTRGG